MGKFLSKYSDRSRMFGGVRKISIDAILPIVLLPIMFAVAAINFYLMIAICIVMPLFLGYAQWLRKSIAPHTKFFFMWTLWSGIYLWIIFEMTVPLMELLPEENFIFITTLFGAAFCFHKVSFEQYVMPHIKNSIIIFVMNNTLFFKSNRHVREHQTITLRHIPMILTIYAI